ncbi:MAG: ATP synthase F1 subunit epsilon [Anaerolineales bacterium]|jgi:F-type H+-transporting ATPase subunit epsilon
MPIRCEIVSQDRLVFEGDADIIVVPGVNGEMGILPHHAPLLSNLGFGILKIRHQGEEEVFAISGGVIEVQPTIVTVLADAAENVMEIDISRAEQAKRRAEKILQEGPPTDADAYEAIEKQLRKSNLRLQAAQRYRRRQRPPTSGEQG